MSNEKTKLYFSLHLTKNTSENNSNLVRYSIVSSASARNWKKPEMQLASGVWLTWKMWLTLTVWLTCGTIYRETIPVQKSDCVSRDSDL
jgi:hypothetical protein